MSGIFEQLLAKADVLIEALNENTKARLAGAGDTAAAPTADKPKATRAKAADKAPAEDAPKTTEAALVAMFEELKGTDTEKRMPALKKIIADQGFTNLKELRMVPSKFDATMAALEAYKASLSAVDGAADGDDDL